MFRVLGPLEVAGRDGPITVGSGQRRRLLAVLLAADGAVVTADALIDALWGDDPPATARRTLHSHVSRLRSLLGEAGGRMLVTQPPGYVLRVPADAVDARRFERLVTEAADARPEDPHRALRLLEEALGLWRGRALAEFDDTDWGRATALRFDELRLVALEERFDAMLALGQHDRVVGEVEATIADAPLRERLRGQLMLALYRCGRHAEALAAYQRWRETLAEELGLEPSDDLQRLERDVLQRSPTLEWAPVATLRSLPAETTSLVGRHRDVAAVRGLLENARLVTLTGVGGVGKTRLALRTAAVAGQDYAQGARWCDLAAVTDAGAVAHAVAMTLGIQPREGQTTEDAIVVGLRSQQVLLVMDNCEHVVKTCAGLVERIIRGCSEVTVLATSRVRLDVGGEHVWPVGPLATGEDDVADAVRLFRDRALALRPTQDLADTAAIARICRQVDGLPLAIELAAARLRALDLSDLGRRLDDRLRMLRRPAVDDRHGALRTVVDWSYNLLSGVERLLFDRLSVFAGGFSLAAAERVCSGGGIPDDEVMDLLARLVDSSMVVAVGSSGEGSRYRLLETLRQYGDERLTERGERQETRDAHARFFVALAERLGERLRGAEEAPAAQAVRRELDNVRAAHGWLVQTGDHDGALRLVVALHWDATWRMRDEVFRWAETTLTLDGVDEHPLVAIACGAAAWGAGVRGQREAARAYAERGARCRHASDESRVWAICGLAHLALWEGRLDECVRHARHASELAVDPYERVLPLEIEVLGLTYGGRTDDALTVAQPLQTLADDLGNPSMTAMARYGLGEALLETQPERAIMVFEEATALCAEVDNRLVAGVAAVSLTSLRARNGTPAEALRSFQHVIALLHGAGDLTHLWVGLRSLVELFARIDESTNAAVLHGAVTGSATAPPVYGADAQRLAAVVKDLDERLGSDMVAARHAQGRDMDDHEIISFARRHIADALSAADAG